MHNHNQSQKEYPVTNYFFLIIVLSGDRENHWQFWKFQEGKLLNKHGLLMDDYEKTLPSPIEESFYRDWKRAQKWIIPSNFQTGCIEAVGFGFLTIHVERFYDEDNNVTIVMRDVILEPKITSYDETFLQQWSVIPLPDSEYFHITHESGRYLSCQTGGNLTLAGRLNLNLSLQIILATGVKGVC